MEAFEIIYSPEVERHDLPRIDMAWQRAIVAAIEEKLTTNPNLYGKPLRNDLAGCWKLRVGDYRIVFQISKRVVRVLAITHRSADYRGIAERL